jgi:DNA modification methylase
MGGEVANMVFTSPPYGSKNGNLYGIPFYGHDSKDTFQDHTGFLCSFMKSCRVNDDSAVLVNLSYNDNNRAGLFEFAVSKEHGFNLYETFVWKKIRSMPLKGDNISRLCEFVFLFSRGRYKIPTRSQNNEGLFNFYESSKEFKQSQGNLAAFPVDLPEHFISIFSLESNCVYEPFCGTGTTLIACERLGRKCRAVEISPAYVAVAIQRWVDVTGGEPVLLTL